MIRIPKTKAKIRYSEMDATEQYARQLIERKARDSIRAFTLATKPDYDMQFVHKRICKALMKWYRGETPYLIISLPPRHGKTELASKRMPAWIHGKRPNAKIIAASYGSTLAKRVTRDVQRIMDSEAYRRIFPDTILPGTQKPPPGEQRKPRNANLHELVGADGYYMGVGVGGPVTGMGADYLVIDDPIKNDKEANSEVYRESVWNWFQATSSTRLEKGGKILIIMTRWHEDDLAGRLLEQAKADPDAYQFVELKLDAIREEKGDLEDPREIGEPLWPQKYNVAHLRRVEASIGPRWWNSLFQQRPTALEGGIIKLANIKYYTELPPTFHRYFQSWDATFKDNIGNDFVVGTVWGVYGRHKYLLDMVRGRWGFVRTCEEIGKLSLKWPKAHRKLVEEKANGAAILDSLKRDGLNEDGTKRKAIVGLIPINPDKQGSKSARLSACATDFQAGDVLLPHPSLQAWTSLVVDELVKFPNARYDDIADSVSQALNDLSGAKSVLQKLTENM